MTLIPGGLLPWINRQFTDINGVPVAGGYLYSYEAGGSTPANTYADSDLQVTNTNPVQLDSSGRATVFLDAIGYRFTLTDANGVQIFDIDGVSDLAQLYLNVLATATVTAAVTSGYTVLPTDTWLTVNSTGGPNPCLINLGAAADQFTPVTIKVIGDTPVEVVALASAGETIEFQPSYTLPAAANPNYPTILINSDGVSTWLIQASHGL